MPDAARSRISFFPMTNDDDDKQDGPSIHVPSLSLARRFQSSHPLPPHKGYHDDKDTPFRQRRHARLKEPSPGSIASTLDIWIFFSRLVRPRVAIHSRKLRDRKLGDNTDGLPSAPSPPSVPSLCKTNPEEIARTRNNNNKKIHWGTPFVAICNWQIGDDCDIHLWSRNHESAWKFAATEIVGREDVS